MFERVSNIATSLIIIGGFFIILLTTSYSIQRHPCDCSADNMDDRFYEMLEQYFYNESELQQMKQSGYGYYTEATHPCFRGYNNPWGCLFVMLQDGSPYEAWCTVCGEYIINVESTEFHYEE